MIVICAWCQQPMGEKPGEPLAVSHSLCQPCYDGLFIVPDGGREIPYMPSWRERLSEPHGLTPKHLVVAALVAFCVGIAFLMGVR